MPSNLILHKVGARKWIARVMVSWGIVSAASAFVVGPNSFYALRFILGVAEAGFFPGIILYLSLWFPGPAARRRGSLVHGGRADLDGDRLAALRRDHETSADRGLADWQMLYIIEAVPAIILGFVVLKYMTDTPSKAHWLKPEEREWLIAKLKTEADAKQSHAGHTAGALSALRDPRVLALALIYFGTSAGLYTLGLWAPLIIRQYGFGSFETGFLHGVPSVLAVIAMILWARHSDRTEERTWHVVIPCVVACLGFVFAGGATSALMIILALVVVNIGISAAKAPLWAMPSMFLSGAGAAAGIAMINSVGNLGGFVGPFAIGWLKNVTGGYSAGLYVVGATLAVSAVVTLMLSRQSKQAPAAGEEGTVH